MKKVLKDLQNFRKSKFKAKRKTTQIRSDYFLYRVLAIIIVLAIPVVLALVSPGFQNLVVNFIALLLNTLVLSNIFLCNVIVIVVILILLIITIYTFNRIK